MRKFSFLFLAALVSLLLVMSLAAAEIPPLGSDTVVFVAYQSGAGGDDANDGTVDAPRKTLSKALALLPDMQGTRIEREG